MEGLKIIVDFPLRGYGAGGRSRVANFPLRKTLGLKHLTKLKLLDSLLQERLTSEWDAFARGGNGGE